MSIGAILGGISLVAGFLGSASDASDAKDQAQAQAALSAKAAEEAKIRTKIRVRQLRRAMFRAEGARVAAAAASGVALRGSPTEVIADAAREEELGIEAVKFEGESIVGQQTGQAALFSQQASSINPVLSGIAGAIGSGGIGTILGG